MSFLEKKKEILLFLILVVFIFCVPQLSKLGFILSEYLSRQPGLNYIFAFVLSVGGFVFSYAQLTRFKEFDVARAIRTYIAFSFGMAGIYYLTYISHVGCFRLPPDIVESASVIDFIYFSFVTVTTVGYGDIIPNHTFVRVLVLFQVLFAIVFVLRVPSSIVQSN